MGLRWWSIIQEDNSEKWIFESRDVEYKPHTVDLICFWGSMAAGGAFWAIFGFLNILAFRWTWVFSLRKKSFD